MSLFVGLRLWATIGMPVGGNPDTPSYFVFTLWGGVRFPVVTAIYSIVDGHRAIATLQALIGTTCWVAAALVLGSLLTHPSVATGVVAAVLGLGLTGPVVRFDNALLSESLSISLVVLLTSLLIRLTCRPSRRAGVATLVTAALWAFSRQNNAIVLLAMAIAVLVVSVRVPPRRLLRYVGAGFAVVGLAGVLLATSNPTVQQFNVAQILQRRIIGGAYEPWFEARGMPETADQIAAGADSQTVTGRTRALMDNPSFGRWVRSEGSSAYRDFLLTHPRYLLSTSVDDRYPIGGFVGGVGGAAEYGSSRAVLPDFIAAIYWPQSAADGLIAAVFLLPMATVGGLRVLRSRTTPLGATMAVAVISVAVANVLIVTHTSGDSYARLLMGSSTSARIAGIWLLAAAIGSPGHPSAQRRDARRAPSEVPPGSPSVS